MVGHAPPPKSGDPGTASPHLLPLTPWAGLCPSQKPLRMPIFGAYLRRSSSACRPPQKLVPAGPEWPHEMKYDGFRLRVERNRDRVRPITRGGYDWTKKYPWIVEDALKNRIKQVLDGEAVVLGVDGVPTSTRCIPASTTRKSSSAPSMC